ncbi:MAG TPA: cellulose binding domain-containing protein, partial [Polyangiaceae bacterium]
TASDSALSSSDDVQVIASTGTSSSLKIQYRASDLSGTDNQIRPHFRLFNLGSSAVTLSQVRIRYWYTRENTTLAQQMACDWAQIGCNLVTSNFTFLSPTRPNANTYLEIGFTSGTLAAGAETGPIQLRLNNANWSDYAESNDYSYSTGGTPPTNYIDWTRITIYLNGVLVWGTEP